MKKLLLILTLSLIFIISCSTEQLPNKPNEPILKEQLKPTLNFSTGACDEKIDSYSKPVADIISKEWKDNTFVVKAYLKTYCGGADITGDFSIKDSNLNLNYNVRTDGPVTSCLCAHELTYEISNLEKKDYNISIGEMKYL